MRVINTSYLIRNFFRGVIGTIRRNTIVSAVGIALFCAIFLSIGLISTKAAVIKDEPRIKQVISLKIQKGDTLWSIAEEHISDEYNTINEYIQEIKTSNGLVDDTINKGSYLIVPYYTNAIN